MNEEKVRNDIIVPFFKELGFDINNIEYETTFSIRLGRFTHEIEGSKERASGRLDILFKNGDENLFLVETKASDHKLSLADKEQAISYARLLKQIAPFAVLTNGIDTKVYDVISMEELIPENFKESAYVKNGYTISIDSELQYRALKKFFGLNFENLMLFCEKQTKSNLVNLIADADNSERKFIPDAYLRREGLIESFNEFIEYKPNVKNITSVSRDNTVFAIIGESGFGKTNAIIDLVNDFGSNSNPVLFFNGSRISSGLLEELAFEFNWEFDGERTGVNVIKRLDEILSQHDLFLTIFIDAIDEVPAQNFEINFDNFIKNLPSNNFKICLSCKESSWSRFLTIASDPSYIKGSVFSKRKDENTALSFKIDAFSNSELEEAIEKYRQQFGLPEIEGSTKELCKNPLILRIISEIYEGTNHIPSNVINQTVLIKYIDTKLKKSTTPEKDLKFLSLFGLKLFDNNTELIFQDELKEDLDVPEYLVAYSLLKRTKDDVGRCLIGFEYDYIRNFIICYHSLKLDCLPPKEIIDVMAQKIHQDIPRSVFSYFERRAKDEVRKVMRIEFSKYNYSRAQEFVEKYQEILDTEFPKIKQKFYPFTDDEIGLLVFYQLNPYYAPRYGFRAISGTEEKVIWLTKENWFDVPMKVQWDIAHKHDISALITSSGFIDSVPEDCARTSIDVQLRKIIEKRALNEFNNFVLMEEFTLDAMSNFNNWLGLPDFNATFWEKALPILIDDLISRTREVIKTTSMKVGHVVYSDPTIEKLSNYLARLKTKKSTILTTLLPFPSKSKIPRLGAWLINEFTLDELRDYLITYFKLVLQEYKLLVDYNFPHLKDKLETYKKMPVRVIGEIEQKNMRYGLTYCLIQGRDEIETEIILKKGESIFDPEQFIVQTSTGPEKIHQYSSSVMSSFFATDSGRDNIIQKAVYELIYDDFKQLYEW